MLSDFLRPDDLCFTLQKEIIPKIKLVDFESMYSEKGRPPVSPVVLLVILILQYIERLSDRAAASNLRFRLDWKIALGLELDFAGIHPTTLVYFRDRLIENEKASLAFDRILEHLKECGLVRKGSKQRIDSTHVIGDVRELSRIELFHETLRLFMENVKTHKPSMPSLLQEKHEYYISSISTRGASDKQKAKFIAEAGLTMKSFIAWAKDYRKAEAIATLASFQTLITVFHQNFMDEGIEDDSAPELIRIATGKDHVCSPHEPEARYGSKGGEGWLGYKMQVAEEVPESEGLPNFITYIDVCDATDHDSKTIEPFIAEQDSKNIKPSEVYADTHYNTADNIEELKLQDIDLKGPVMPVPNKQREPENQGFTYDAEKQILRCPLGFEAEKTSFQKPDKIHGRFSAITCLKCKRRKLCKPQKSGKRVTIRDSKEILKTRRNEMQTEAFKKDMHKRNGIEGTISGLVRGQRLRRSRYRGKSKVQLHIKFSGAAANLIRLHGVRCVQNAKKAA
ncbi:MAG: transposase [Proteobacteria bacterium]|nr:transposase [Pseudomonadota bacterium]